MRPVLERRKPQPSRQKTRPVRVGAAPRELPSEVVLTPGEDLVPRECSASLDSVESVSVAVLLERLGRLSGLRMQEVCRALAVAMDC